METQEQLRKEIKGLLNTVSGLAEKWDIDPVYLHRFKNGMKIGKKTESKIKEGLIKAKKDLL